MTRRSDYEPVISKSITVNIDVTSAFRVWTEQITHWWPLAHSLSGDPDRQMILECHARGRLFERASSGKDYDWGFVTVWEPPTFLALQWFPGNGAVEPTRVDVRFHTLDGGRTRIELNHRGPEFIGERWNQLVSRFESAWTSVVDSYAHFIKRPAPDTVPSGVVAGLRGTATMTATTATTAVAMGSGAVAGTLATPAMLALMERAAVSAVEHLLPASMATVGTAVDLKHLAPTPEGSHVRAEATVTDVNGRRMTFEITAWDDYEKIGAAVHIRYVIDRARFAERLASKQEGA